MRGNDIVDLKQAAQDSDWRRKGYLQKIYTAEEQECIGNALEPNVLVWLFWSMKEAAYKIFSRYTGLHKYIPFRIACTVGPLELPFSLSPPSAMTVYGKAMHDGKIYFTKSLLNFEEQYIHSLAAIHSDLLETADIQIRDFDPDFNYKKLNPDSVSHHGRYLALLFNAAD
jgi:hypothetical protein